MASDLAHERLFFRHSIERKRSLGYHAFKLLKPPFESNSSGTVGAWEGNQLYDITWDAPQPLALIVGRFKHQIWLSIETISGELQDVFAANQRVARLEFLNIKYSASGQIESIEITKKNETLIRFKRFGDVDFELSGSQLLDGWNEFDSAADAIAAVRTHCQFESTLRTLTVSESSESYCVVNELGRTLEPRACTTACITGQRPLDNAKASLALCEAIKNGDASGVDAAIDEGASLAQLPDSSLSPLESALFRIEKPGGHECASALISAGARMSGLLAGCFESFISETCSVAAAKFLINAGAEIDEPNKSGLTPIFAAVCQRNIDAIKLLVACGADPNAPIKHSDLTVTEWVKRKFDETSKQGEQQVFAQMLSVLTGEEVQPPTKSPIPEEFQVENERFRTALQAQQVLSQLPTTVAVESADDGTRLRNEQHFLELGRALEKLGFVQLGKFIDDFAMPKAIVAYTDADTKIDAVIQDYWWVDFVGCRLLAYGKDGHLFACSDTNLKTPDEPDLDCLTAIEIPSAEPATLLAELKSAVKKRSVELLDTPADEFATRFIDGYHRVLSETKQVFQSRLVDEAVRVDGELPLFERRQIYLDFSSWDDPSRTSATDWDDTFSELLNCNRDDRFQVTMGVRNAFRLFAMQQLQFAGASNDDTFLSPGCELACLLFENLKGKWKQELAFGRIEELWMGLLLCQASSARELTSRPLFEEICNSVQPRMATRKYRSGGDPPLPLGEWTMLFVSGFRKRAIPRLLEWRERLEKCRNKRAKLLLNALDAWNQSDESALAESLSKSIQEFQNSGSDARPNLLIHHFALPESLLFNAAVQSGITPRLQSDLTDHLLHTRSSNTAVEHKPPLSLD